MHFRPIRQTETKPAQWHNSWGPLRKKLYLSTIIIGVLMLSVCWELYSIYRIGHMVILFRGIIIRPIVTKKISNSVFYIFHNIRLPNRLLSHYFNSKVPKSYVVRRRSWGREPEILWSRGLSYRRQLRWQYVCMTGDNLVWFALQDSLPSD